ncbi:MAG: NUDIX hydrolase, partial [Sedimenticolaceae bacterium]
MRWAPAVTVAAVIREQDRYLMVEERPEGHAVINQPAGHLEFGERLLDAVQREVREETGRRFTPTGLVGVYQWTVPDTERSFLRFCFCGSVSAPLPGAVLDPDIQATHWLSVDE